MLLTKNEFNIVREFGVANENGERKAYICKKIKDYESYFHNNACCGLYGRQCATRQMEQ